MMYVAYGGPVTLFVGRGAATGPILEFNSSMRRTQSKNFKQPGVKLRFGRERVAHVRCATLLESALTSGKSNVP